MMRISVGVGLLAALLVTYWIHPTSAWVALFATSTGSVMKRRKPPCSGSTSKHPHNANERAEPSRLRVSSTRPAQAGHHSTSTIIDIQVAEQRFRALSSS